MIIKTESLTPLLHSIIENKETEASFTGKYDDFEESGTYLCRKCGLALFHSKTKFHSGCGWASFDGEIKNTVKREADADGRRTEILCSRCNAHLGHVFEGENFTKKNTRHCVNSASLDFVVSSDVKDTEEAIVAGGCFWGVEALFQKLDGVLKTQVGYTGGKTQNPTYKQICSGSSGHYEAIRIVYDINTLDYESVLKYFFQIHDFTQKNGQGPDIGQQYLSVIFYYNEAQKKSAEKLIISLQNQGYLVATKILPVSVFWQAEQNHQSYYSKNHQKPYCHTRKKINF